MQNKSGVIRATGIIALVLVIIAIAWYLLEEFSGGWVSSDLQRVANDLQAIAGNRGQYLGFMSVDILYNLGIIALGALFYLIFRSFNRSLALFGGLGFIITGAMWLMLDIPGFAQYQLALDYSVASGAAASAIVERAAELSFWIDYSNAITSILMAISLFSFGVVIIRSTAINRLLGWLAVIAGTLMLASLVNTFEGSLVWQIAYYVTEFWILVMGLWLVLRGVKTFEVEPAQTATKA
ncbi:DUF4386 family protein [Chloroflexota bacterium]